MSQVHGRAVRQPLCTLDISPGSSPWCQMCTKWCKCTSREAHLDKYLDVVLAFVREEVQRCTFLYPSA